MAGSNIAFERYGGGSSPLARRRSLRRPKEANRSKRLRSIAATSLSFRANARDLTSLVRFQTNSGVLIAAVSGPLFRYSRERWRRRPPCHPRLQWMGRSPSLGFTMSWLIALSHRKAEHSTTIDRGLPVPRVDMSTRSSQASAAVIGRRHTAAVL